jgi:hypothetical protein
VAVFVISRQSRIHTSGAEDVVGSVVSNMVAEHEGGIRPGMDTDETLVGLDLPKGAAREAGDVGFEVRPEDVPLSLARNYTPLLDVMNTGEGSG